MKVQILMNEGSYGELIERDVDIEAFEFVVAELLSKVKVGKEIVRIEGDVSIILV